MTTAADVSENAVAGGPPPLTVPVPRSLARLLSACLTIVALATVPAAFAQTTVTFESFGVGNAYRPGGPVAARVLVTSDLDEPVPGLVEWEIPNPDGDLQVNRRSLEIPGRGGTARTWVLGELPSRGAAIAIASEPWTVRVYEYRDGRRVRELATARLSPTVCAARPIEQSHGVAVVIGPNDAGLAGYAAISGRNDRPGLNEYLDIITSVEPSNLPDLWPGLQQIDLLVWTADEPRFQPATLGTRLVVAGAIRSWLERGGHLIITLPRSGDPWRLARGDGVLDDLLEGLTPITEPAYPLAQALPALSDRRELRDPDRTITLHRFDAENLPPGWRPLAGFRPAPPPFDPDGVEIPEDAPPEIAARLIEAAREAIPEPSPIIHAIRRNVGHGTIDVLGIDPSNPDLRVQQSSGLPATWVFWNPILGRRTFTVPASVADTLAASRTLVVPSRTEAIGRDSLISDAIGLRGSASSGMLAAITIFGLYWLFAGPVGFAILGRLGWRRQAWLAFVCTSLVAAGIAWTLGRFTVDSGTAMRHLTVLRHRYEPAESEVDTPLDHATCWFSVRLPGYGTAEVAVGEADADETAVADLLHHYSPPPNGFGTGFLDVDRYDAEVRRRDRLVVPSRATSAEFVADWSGRPQATGDVWASTIKVHPSDPVRIEMIERGVIQITGTLVNGTGLPLQDVLVVLTSPQRDAPLPLGDDGLPAVAGNTAPDTDQPSNLGAMIIAMPSGWQPGALLELGTSAGFGRQRRLAFTGINSMSGQLNTRFPASNEGVVGMVDGSLPWGSTQFLQALSLFDMLPPPPIVQQPSGGRSAFRLERLLGRGLDLSRHLSEPSLVVIALASSAPCPVPIAVDGEELPGEGDVLLQWIHPLPVDVDWLVPPRPTWFDRPDESEESDDGEAARADRPTTDSDAKGVDVAWR